MKPSLNPHTLILLVLACFAASALGVSAAFIIGATQAALPLSLFLSYVGFAFIAIALLFVFATIIYFIVMRWGLTTDTRGLHVE